MGTVMQNQKLIAVAIVSLAAGLVIGTILGGFGGFGLGELLQDGPAARVPAPTEAPTTTGPIKLEDDTLPALNQKKPYERDELERPIAGFNADKLRELLGIADKAHLFGEGKEFWEYNQLTINPQTHQPDKKTTIQVLFGCVDFINYDPPLADEDDPGVGGKPGRAVGSGTTGKA